MWEVIAALVSVALTSLLAWFIGTRVSYGWDEVKRQRESDLAALQSFYRCYGAFFAAWKMWDVYLESHTSKGAHPSFLADDSTAWGILKEAEDAESGFETILVKLASEYASDRRDRILLASFRQGAQSLRESIRVGRALTRKAKPTSREDSTREEKNQRLTDYREYRAFKALCEYVAIRLAHGHIMPEARRGKVKGLARLWISFSPRRAKRSFPVLLGLGPTRTIDQNRAIEAFIEVTQTDGIRGCWHENAEKELQLPPVIRAENGRGGNVGYRVPGDDTINDPLASQSTAERSAGSAVGRLGRGGSGRVWIGRCRREPPDIAFGWCARAGPSAGAPEQGVRDG
jgi:hypothetical protein